MKQKTISRIGKGLLGLAVAGFFGGLSTVAHTRWKTDDIGRKFGRIAYIKSLLDEEGSVTINERSYKEGLSVAYNALISDPNLAEERKTYNADIRTAVGGVATAVGSIPLALAGGMMLGSRRREDSGQ
jgi:ribosomal protein S9